MYKYTVAYAMGWASSGLADGQIGYSAFFWSSSVYVYLIADKINVLNNAPLWLLTQHVICKVTSSEIYQVIVVEYKKCTICLQNVVE